MPWPRRYALAEQGLPQPPIVPPYPAQRLRVTPRGKSPVRECRTPGSVRGEPGNRHPYRDRGVPHRWLCFCSHTTFIGLAGIQRHGPR
jgi:hypothetical protein